MSKIQINELNNNSELEVLNNQETTEVVGGWYGGYYDYSKYAYVDQFNGNSTYQVALGGSNYNSTYQSNKAKIYQ